MNYCQYILRTMPGTAENVIFHMMKAEADEDGRYNWGRGEEGGGALLELGLSDVTSPS